MMPVKIGCVGLRRGRHLLKYLLKSQLAQTVAICDINVNLINITKEELSLPNLQTFTSYEEFLKSDIDAIIIATPATNHVEYVKMAMESGKHVLSEIPAIATLDEAKILKEVVLAYPNLKYMCAENCCYLSVIQDWKKMYENGDIGEVFYAECDYLHDCRYLMQDNSGNLLWRAYYDSINYLTHDVGVMLYLLSDKVESVSAFTPGVKVTPANYTGNSNQIGIFKTEKGAIIKMVCALAINAQPTHNYAVYGTKGSLERNRNENWVDADTFATFSTEENQRVYERKIIPTKKTSNLGGHGDVDIKMLEAFLECIINDTPSPIDVDMAINMSIAGIYAVESAKQGGIPIKIPKI